ncbi:hypothetical protein [Coleofasciculus sp. E2-BRE-01]|uniref:hypothetical protein n=1 Tax=Coleofasciculus sp. E2-BRE-01 TaxID=3069524 RepID=UPI0032F21256
MNSLSATSVHYDLNKFTYILDKITSAEFCQEPFKHIEIFDFLSEEHFNSIITSSQVAIPKANDSKSLIDTLFDKDYEIIRFPGCANSVNHYLNWLEDKSVYKNPTKPCEGMGMALRLKNPQDKILLELKNFFASDIFKKALEDKFDITRPTAMDTGLQKYLYGYEISPHPDIRKKALTYMLNVNPSDNSEDLDIHTHYLTFKPHKQFIGEFWHHNENIDTCWVPWEWCNTVKKQCRNNSIVIFAPSWDTLHAIKANYDHLQTQRTQFYGNLWYKDISRMPKVYYYQFDIKPVIRPGSKPQVRTPKSMVKSWVKKLLPHRGHNKSDRQAVQIFPQDYD